MGTNTLCCEQVTPPAERCASPGVVVLSSSLKLLHMNRRAAELLRPVTRTEGEAAGNQVGQADLSAAAAELIAEIFNVLRQPSEGKRGDLFEVTRQVGNPAQPLVLHGFGVPDKRGLEPARIVITIERSALRQPTATEQADDEAKEGEQPNTRDRVSRPPFRSSSANVAANSL